MTSAAVGAAAAEMERRRRDEEELMTGYTPTELADGWEFKILRSCTHAFRNPERMRQAVEEESRSGWVLVEKFDDQRLRFKRPASARGAIGTLTTPNPTTGIDPYRTTFGISELRMMLTIMGSVFSAMALVLLIVYLVKHQ